MKAQRRVPEYTLGNFSLTSCALVLVISLTPARSHANVVGNDTQNFNPITSGVDFVTVQSSETLVPGFINFGYFLNGAKNVLPPTIDALGNKVQFDDSLVAQDFNFGFGVTRRFDFGVNVSHILKQSTDRSGSGAQFSAVGLNEIRVNAKYKLIKRDPFGLAIIPSVNFNQVKNNPFQGLDAGPTLNMEVAADTTVGGVLVAANAGYRFRSPGATVPQSIYSPIHNQAIASIAANYYVPSLTTKFIAELFASKQIKSSDSTEASTFSTELLGGVKWDATESLAVHAGVSMKLTEGLFSPDARIYVGLNYAFLAINALAGVAEPAPIIQTQNVTNVTTNVTKINSETNVFDGYQPEEIEAMAKVPFDQLMLDHEFTLRRAINLDKLEGGKSPFEVVRLDGLEFDNASYELLPKNKVLLDHLAQYLAAEPHVLKIRVEGHTDSRGAETRNQPLSENRSKSVVEYLKDHGLAADIGVETAGYGSTRPIADNSNPQGRQSNRRVEVRILRRIRVKAQKVESSQQ